MGNGNTQAPPWTEKEFKLLLANENLSDEEVARLTGRSLGAVGVVRAGVKSWRKSGKNPGQILSHMMIRVLEAQSKQKREDA